MWEWINNALISHWWTGVETIALLLTLCAVIYYTIQTKSLANSTREMANSNRRIAIAQSLPVVRIILVDLNKFFFTPVIRNLDKKPSRIRVRVLLWIQGIQLTIPPEHHYSGSHIWELPAMFSNEGILGNFKLPEIFQLNERLIRESGIELKDHFDGSARLVIESWVTHVHQTDEDVHSDEFRNATAKWYWRDYKWIPDVIVEKVE